MAAPDEAVTCMEEVVTELSAAEAAMSAVATTISFAVQDDARQGILVDGKALAAPTASMPIMGKTTIAIPSVGTITVEPQIKNRSALLTRRDGATQVMRNA